MPSKDEQKREIIGKEGHRRQPNWTKLIQQPMKQRLLTPARRVGASWSRSGQALSELWNTWQTILQSIMRASVEIYMFTYSLKHFYTVLKLNWKLLYPGMWRYVGWKSSTFRDNVLPTSSEYYPFCFSTLQVEAAGTCGTLVHIHRTTWRHIPEDSNLHSHRHGNLKPHMEFYYSVLTPNMRFLL
jgi:hypothetical protein